MKFAVVAALFAAVAAKEQCDWKQYTYKVFDDAKCTKLNKELTGEGHMPKEASFLFEDKCQTENGQGKWGYTFFCDAKGMHEKVWDNQKCEGPTVAIINMPWDECNPIPGEEKLWFIPSTTQF